MKKICKLKTSWRSKTLISPPSLCCKLSDWNKLWCNVSLNNQLSDTIAGPYRVLRVGKIEKDQLHFTPIIPINCSIVNYDTMFSQPRSSCNHFSMLGFYRFSFCCIKIIASWAFVSSFRRRSTSRESFKFNNNMTTTIHSFITCLKIK